MFYKLNVGNSPEFLCDLIPPSVGETNNYNLRNSHNISQNYKQIIDIPTVIFSVESYGI